MISPSTAAGDHEVDRHGLVRRRGAPRARPPAPLPASHPRAAEGARAAPAPATGGSSRPGTRSSRRTSPARSAACRSSRADADRIAVVDGAAGAERLDLDRVPVLEHHRFQRQLVDQRLDRVGRPEPAVVGGGGVAPGGADLDLVDPVGARPAAHGLRGHQIGLARARPDPEHREPPGPLELARTARAGASVMWYRPPRSR